VAIFAALLDQELVTGGDGRHHPEGAVEDRLSRPGHDVDYRLTPAGHDRLAALGVEVPGSPEKELPLRYCIDWTEQAHHLSGNVGRALTRWLVDSAWIERLPGSRAVRVTEVGHRELRRKLGVAVPAG
jgi:hypothetical protein